MSASEPRPWWASDGPDAAPDHDPLTAHRAARRGDGGSSPPEDDGSWWAPASEAVARLARDLAKAGDAAQAGDGAQAGDAAHDGSPAGGGPTSGEVPRSDDASPPGRSDDGPGGGGGDHDPDICGVCPICVGLRALGESRPELVGHLAAAARHLAAAFRSVAEAAAPDADRPDDDGLERIDLDA